MGGPPRHELALVADSFCPPPKQSEDEPFNVRLSDESFETYELDPPPYTLAVTKKQLKQMYRDMVTVRYAIGGPDDRDVGRLLFEKGPPSLTVVCCCV